MYQFNSFTKSYRIDALYNFAGGIVLGSAVRVAGVKVGKVDQVKFFGILGSGLYLMMGFWGQVST